MIIEDKVIIDALEKMYYWNCRKSAEIISGETKRLYRLQYSHDNNTALAYIIAGSWKYDVLHYFNIHEDADKFYDDFGKE